MTEQDKTYIKTHRSWVKATTLNCNEHYMNISHNNDKISLLTRQLELDKEQLLTNSKYLEQGEVAFQEWCENNGVDPNVEL